MCANGIVKGGANIERRWLGILTFFILFLSSCLPTFSLLPCFLIWFYWWKNSQCLLLKWNLTFRQSQQQRDSCRNHATKVLLVIFHENECFCLPFNHRLCNVELDSKRKKKQKYMVFTSKKSQNNWLPTVRRQGENK